MIQKYPWSNLRISYSSWCPRLCSSQNGLSDVIGVFEISDQCLLFAIGHPAVLVTVQTLFRTTVLPSPVNSNSSHWAYPFTALLSTKTVIGWGEGCVCVQQLFAIFDPNLQRRLVWRPVSTTDVTNFITLNVSVFKKARFFPLKKQEKTSVDSQGL